MFGCAGSGVKPVLNSAVPGKSSVHRQGCWLRDSADATILAAECKEVSDDEPLTTRSSLR